MLNYNVTQPHIYIISFKTFIERSSSKWLEQKKNTKEKNNILFNGNHRMRKKKTSSFMMNLPIFMDAIHNTLPQLDHHIMVPLLQKLCRAKK